MGNGLSGFELPGQGPDAMVIILASLPPSTKAGQSQPTGAELLIGPESLKLELAGLDSLVLQQTCRERGEVDPSVVHLPFMRL